MYTSHTKFRFFSSSSSSLRCIFCLSINARTNSVYVWMGTHISMRDIKWVYVRSLQTKSCKINNNKARDLTAKKPLQKQCATPIPWEEFSYPTCIRCARMLSLRECTSSVCSVCIPMHMAGCTCVCFSYTEHTEPTKKSLSLRSRRDHLQNDQSPLEFHSARLLISNIISRFL